MLFPIKKNIECKYHKRFDIILHFLKHLIGHIRAETQHLCISPIVDVICLQGTRKIVCEVDCINLMTWFNCNEYSNVAEPVLLPYYVL